MKKYFDTNVFKLGLVFFAGYYIGKSDITFKLTVDRNNK